MTSIKAEDVERFVSAWPNYVDRFGAVMNGVKRRTETWRRTALEGKK